MHNDENILIIVLNWNGSQDTLDCCESLKSLHSIKQVSADILIIDNNSDLKEYDLLTTGLAKNFGEPKALEVPDELISHYGIIENQAYDNIFLFRSKTNHGFAKGCNLGSKYAEYYNYDYVLFLNNDTIVEPNFLLPLVTCLQTADAAIPQIRYHYDKDIMWNCGGEITKYGSRKYFYANENIKKIVFPSRIFPVTFATGCCILFKTKYFSEIGRFSERFFFGEEDIELALRLRTKHSTIVCTTDSVIYHKVGSSIQGDPERLLRKAYIHYLNRFVNMKLHLGFSWYIWLIPSTLKVLLNLRKINHLELKGIFAFLSSLVSDSYKLTEVNKDKFESILRDGIK
ncbi:glycosyltransferase family 2 protein [Huaxiibacter chinensis]